MYSPHTNWHVYLMTGPVCLKHVLNLHKGMEQAVIMSAISGVAMKNIHRCVCVCVRVHVCGGGGGGLSTNAAECSDTIL
jgi:hypothetical protein